MSSCIKNVSDSDHTKASFVEHCDFVKCLPEYQLISKESIEDTNNSSTLLQEVILPSVSTSTGDSFNSLNKNISLIRQDESKKSTNLTNYLETSGKLDSCLTVKSKLSCGFDDSKSNESLNSNFSTISLTDQAFMNSSINLSGSYGKHLTNQSFLLHDVNLPSSDMRSLVTNSTTVVGSLENSLFQQGVMHLNRTSSGGRYNNRNTAHSIATINPVSTSQYGSQQLVFQMHRTGEVNICLGLY